MIVQDLINILNGLESKEIAIEGPNGGAKDIDSISYGLDMSGRICTIILVPDKDRHSWPHGGTGRHKGL